MVTEGVILKGFLGFMPKYIEYQFEMKASDATLALGLVALISVIAGTILSAKIIEKFKFEAKECAFMSLVIFFITSFCFLILFNYCPEVKFINELDQFECDQCDCANQFEPVCIQTTFDDSTNVFQSACHAGCATPNVDNQFQNCECLMNNLRLNETVSNLNCLKGLKCWKSLVINGITAFLIVFFTAMSIIPHLKTLLGCVDQNDQSVALGIKNSIAVILGNFGGTLLVVTIDTVCVNLKFYYSPFAKKTHHYPKLTKVIVKKDFNIDQLKEFFKPLKLNICGGNEID
ncbi:solute carrier organic anion transporter family member 4A1 [Brachionus plicatilis]|uniref:Solute carrier organic anion transporter family member 4A1 n=1 Tax=Brachionus plicatilis TaxID=10195 RepID=A0A3M7SCC8_BRAPC|nr:solute carrier organic anion transporter family member 4A1 [Brachionus plicatilis]